MKTKIKKFKKKLHFWTVKEKKSVLAMTNKGESVRKIKITLFKGDPTITLRSLGAMMTTLRKNPDWANHQPNYPGNKIPTARSLSEKREAKKGNRSSTKKTARTHVIGSNTKKKATNYQWTQEEKQSILSNINMKPADIKSTVFPNHSHLTVYKISKQLHNLRAKIRRGEMVLAKVAKVKKVKTPQVNPNQLEIDYTGKAEHLFQKFNLKTSVLRDDLSSLLELIDDSKFDTDSKTQMKVAISKIANATFKIEQNSLAEALKV